MFLMLEKGYYKGKPNLVGSNQCI